MNALQVVTTSALEANELELFSFHSDTVPRQGDQLFLWQRTLEISMLARVTLVRWEIAVGADKIIPGKAKEEWDVTIFVEPWDILQQPLLNQWEAFVREG